MSTAPLKVLILGGYGVFGGRLVKLLADEVRVELIVAGRSLKKAQEFCAATPTQGRALAIAFDRDGDIGAQLDSLAPDLIVDASGPFQAYGEDPYRVVRAALERGISYMDLADGSDFVRGIAQFDAAARKRSVFVLSGVSSFPVLSAAVVRRLGDGLARVKTITAGIAPSPFAGLGLNVIRAIASYAGRPVRLTRDGNPATGYALTETLRYTIAPPGALPLGNRRFSLVDVPDLQLLPLQWPGLRSIWTGAGTVPEILHRGLNALAWLVRLRLVPSLAPLGPLFHRASNILTWGEHRGGMFVSIEGVKADGGAVTRSWHLIAEGDDGPFIPSMAIEALVRGLLSGIRPAPGARPATAELELSDYEALFARRAMVTGTRERDPAAGPSSLYQRLMGTAWDRLPEPIRQMHTLKGTMTARGMATVERGRGMLARLVAAVFRFPQAGSNVPVEVTFTAGESGELWERNFAGRRFSSFQEAGSGTWEHLLSERFGPFRFALALVVEQERLLLIPRGWSMFGLPLPAAWAPFGTSYEHVVDERFAFHVEICLPLAGLIVSYRGQLERCPTTA